MKTRRQREIQEAEGVPVTPPQSLEATTHRPRRGTRPTTSRAPTTEPTQTQSYPTDLTQSQPSDHANIQPELTQSQPPSLEPATRARTRRGTSRAPSNVTSRATSHASSRATSRAPTAEPTQSQSNPIYLTQAEPSQHGDTQPERLLSQLPSLEPTKQSRTRRGTSGATSKVTTRAAGHASSRATSRATSRAPTAEPVQLGSSKAVAIQIDSTTESEPSEFDYAHPQATEAEYNESEPTPSEPDQPVFIKTEPVESHASSRATGRAPTAELFQVGSSRADAIQIDSADSESSESDYTHSEATEAEFNESEPPPFEPDQPVLIKAEPVDDGPVQSQSIQSETPHFEPPHFEPPQAEPLQVAPPQVTPPQVEPPQVTPLQAGSIHGPLTPNLEAAKRQFEKDYARREAVAGAEKSLLYDLKTRNMRADQKRARAGRPKANITKVSARYEEYKKRQEKERKAKSVETSTQEDTTQTDDPGPSEDDGSTARTSPENAPVEAIRVTGPRDTNKEDDELAQRASPSKKSPISSRPFKPRSRSSSQDAIEAANETWRARQIQVDEAARTLARARFGVPAKKAAAHPVHGGKTTAHPVPVASKGTTAVDGAPSQAPQHVTQDALPPPKRTTLDAYIDKEVARVRKIPPGERTAVEARNLEYLIGLKATRLGPEWRPTAPTAIVAQPYDGKVTAAHVDIVEPTSRENYDEQLKLRIRQEAEARAALAQTSLPPSLEDPPLAVQNWPQVSGANRETLMKFCVSARLAPQCDPSYQLDKHPLSLAVDDDVFLDIMHVIVNHPKNRHGVLYNLKNIHPTVEANAERMIDSGHLDLWTGNSIADKITVTDSPRSTPVTSQPDRLRNLRTSSRISKPQGSKRRQALAEVDAQSHIEDGPSSQNKAARRIVRMPKYFTGPMDKRTVLSDNRQQDVPLIESDNMSSDDESMLDLNGNHGDEDDVQMEDQSNQQDQVDQHNMSAGGPTTPTTQTSTPAAAQTPKSRGWVFGSLLPSAARTVSKFLPRWRQQPPSLPPTPTQQPVPVPATEPRQRPHVSATQGRGRVERRKALTHSSIAREPNGAVRLMTKGAIGVMKQKAENRKTLENRAKRAEEALASRDSIIRSLHKQVQDVQQSSRENARQLREAESNQGQPIDLTRPTPVEKQKRKRAPSPDVIPNPVPNGFGMDLEYFGFDDDDSQYFDNEEEHESRPSTSKRLRTLESSSTDKAVVPLNDTAAETGNLDIIPRPGSPVGSPVGNPFRATPYTGRLFSNASVPSRQDPLSNLFNEEAASDEAAEQQVTTSIKSPTTQPNTSTVSSEQPSVQEKSQATQPNTSTVSSPKVTFQDDPQVTKTNPFFTPRVTSQNKPQTGRSFFFNVPSVPVTTQDDPQVTTPNPFFNMANPFFNTPSSSVPTQDKPQVSQPNTFTVPSEQPPMSQPNTFTVPSEQQVSQPNTFTVPSEQPVPQEQPQVSQPNSFTVPSEQPQVSQPNPFTVPSEQPQMSQPNTFTVPSEQPVLQEQPQVSQPDIFTVPSQQPVLQEQPQVSQPNTFTVPSEQPQVSQPSPFTVPFEQPQVSQPNSFIVPSEQPQVSQPNSFTVPSEQPVLQEQPQVIKPTPSFTMPSPSVTTQDKPQVRKPNIFAMPSPNVTTQDTPRTFQPNSFTAPSPSSATTQGTSRVIGPTTFTVPSPNEGDSDFSFAEPPTSSFPKASFRALQATPTPAQKQQAAESPGFSFAEPPKASTPKISTLSTPKASSSFKAAPVLLAPAEKQPAPQAPLPPTLSDISLARQREQALKYAAKTPSRLHEATRPSSTNAESESPNDQPPKSVPSLAPAPVTAPTPPQATAPLPSVRHASHPERRKEAVEKLKEIGLTDFEDYMNSDDVSQFIKDTHNKTWQEDPESVKQSKKRCLLEIDYYQVWEQPMTNSMSHVFEAPTQQRKRPKTRRSPPDNVPVVAETSRPVEKRQTNEDVSADLDFFQGMRPAPKPWNPPPPGATTSRAAPPQNPKPQSKFNFMETYNDLLAYYAERDKPKARKGS